MRGNRLVYVRSAQLQKTPDAHCGRSTSPTWEKGFVEYVEYLAAKGYVPPNGQGWVDHIRVKGNEANHEIRLMKKSDSEELISFSEMLLKFIYEFPQRVPKAGEA